MNASRPTRVVAVIAVALGSLSLASCGLGATSPATSSAAGSSAPSPTASGTAAAGVGGTLSSPKLCAAAPLADVQKLLKQTVSSATPEPLECTWGSGGAVTANVFSDDASEHYYNGEGTGTPVTGFGSEAQWAAPVPNQTAPYLACHTGSRTVTITVGADLPDTTIPFTGNSPAGYQIAPADTLTYVDEEGRVCADLLDAMK